MIKSVIVNQCGEAALVPIPDVPDERALMEKRAVLLEEAVAQPIVERLPAETGFRQQLIQHGGRPIFPVGRGEELLEAFGRGAFAAQRRQADDAVLVGEGFQPVRAERRAVGEFRAGLARPAVAEQPGDRDLQRVIRSARMSVEKPLRRVVRMRLRQAVRVFLGGDSLPVDEVERNFRQRLICDLDRLVNSSDVSVEIRR